MDSIFYILLLVGIIIGFICILAGMYLLFKRRQGYTEIKTSWVGEIKTYHPGIVLIFFGVFIFGFSTFSYGEYRKLLAMERKVRELTYALESSNKQMKEGAHLIFIEPDLHGSIPFLGNIPFLQPHFSHFGKDNVSVAGLIEKDEENKMWLVMDGSISVGDKKTVKLMIDNVSKNVEKLIGKKVEITGAPVILQNTKGENYIAFSILHIQEKKGDD